MRLLIGVIKRTLDKVKEYQRGYDAKYVGKKEELDLEELVRELLGLEEL